MKLQKRKKIIELKVFSFVQILRRFWNNKTQNLFENVVEHNSELAKFQQKNLSICESSKIKHGLSEKKI